MVLSRSRLSWGFHDMARYYGFKKRIRQPKTNDSIIATFCPLYCLSIIFSSLFVLFTFLKRKCGTNSICGILRTCMRIQIHGCHTTKNNDQAYSSSSLRISRRERIRLDMRPLTFNRNTSNVFSLAHGNSLLQIKGYDMICHCCGTLWYRVCYCTIMLHDRHIFGAS